MWNTRKMPSRWIMTLIVLIIFIFGYCNKKSPTPEENDKFIQVFAAYLLKAGGLNHSDSLRTAIFDSTCQQFDYSREKFQKRMAELTREPEKWGEVMERVQKLMAQIKAHEPLQEK